MCSKDFWYASVDINVIRDKKLSQTAKFIFTVLCTFAGLKGRGCWPSNKVLADIADVSERTVIRAYKELEERGVISRSARFKDKAQITSYTQIIGHNAPCYEDEESTPAISDGSDTRDLKPSTPMADRTRISEQDIKDSLTWEAELPNLGDVSISRKVFADILINRAMHTAQKSQTGQTFRSKNPKEVYTLEDAPDIMKTTAEFFLRKTGRQGLMWPEISALRKLAATQYPVRVQKEICTAVNRFLKRGQSLGTLTFGYIAGSLENQPTWGRKPRAKPKPERIPRCTDAENDAVIAEIEALQAEFDREKRR